MELSNEVNGEIKESVVQVKAKVSTKDELILNIKEWIKIDSDELLPGDICSVTRNLGSVSGTTTSPMNNSNNNNTSTTPPTNNAAQTYSLPCDLLLIRGQCVINESMLTGESVPVIKVFILIILF